MANDIGFLEMVWSDELRDYSNNDIYGSFENNNINYRLYHYTNMKVLDSLLTECTFWASHIMYLNDPKECETEAEKVDAKGTNYAGIFTVSFSQENDSLHQWITYAKESGVAIELDYGLIRDNEFNKYEWYCVDSIYKQRGSEKIKLSEQLAVKLQSLIYKIDYNNIPNSEVKTQNSFRNLWQAAYKKRTGYKDENEIRLAIFATKKKNTDAEIMKSKIQYFYLPGKNILRPFLKLTLGYVENTGGCERQFVPCLPIKSLTVGPSGIQQTVFDNLVHRIKYGECKVYNYLEDEEQFVENFCRYLYEAYCKDQNIESDIDLKFGSLHYDQKKSLYDNIFGALNLTLKSQSVDLTAHKEFFTALINSWIKENSAIVPANMLGDKHVDEISDKLKTDLTKISQDFYFSKEGILIRKSKIPYIF